MERRSNSAWHVRCFGSTTRTPQYRPLGPANTTTKGGHTMIRVLAVLGAVLMTVSLGVSTTTAQMKPDPAQPKTLEQKSDSKMGQRVEGTIKAVSGNVVTLEDGTKLSIPSSVKVAKDQLKPGAQITAEYEERGGPKGATSVLIKG